MSGKEDFLKKFKILEELGKGGMGVVYKARQISLDRLVAVKMLARELAAEELYVRRFVEEARAIARMRNHENIVEVYDFIETEDSFYIVMEYVEGESLGAKLKRLGKLPLAESVEILSRVARAIDHAHQAGVIHRDIKPENIIVDARGRIKVMDFGVAHLSGASHRTRTGTVLGTPLYMAPEQARAAAVDARTDVYAMGVLMYQMTTGALPFTGDTPIAVAMKHLTEMPRPPREIEPELPERIEIGILKALEKSPIRRFQTAAEMAAFFEDPALRVALDQSPQEGSSHAALTLLGEGMEPDSLVRGSQGNRPDRTDRSDRSDRWDRSDRTTPTAASLPPEQPVPAGQPVPAAPNRLGAADWLIAAALLLLGALIAYFFWPAKLP